MKSEQNELRKLQLKELMILKEFKRICEKHNLRWFLSGGTLLGAVRHKGFIPWDDDVDVNMPYKDYLRFLNIAQKELGDVFFLQTMETEKNYYTPFAKIRLNNSTFLDSKFKNRHINHGIWLDVFPLINVTPYNINRKYQIFRVCSALQMDDLIKCNRDEIEKDYGKRLIKSVVFFHKLIPFFIRKKFSNLLVKNSCASNKTAWIYEMTNQPNIIFPSNVFDKTVYVEFENEYFPAPKYYKEYLTILYGNYMELPPKEERVGIHCDIIDFEHSYYN